MMLALEMLGMLAMLLLGVWLSAFFSGSETGFYRLSMPRLWIDSKAGDSTASRLLYFAQHPSQYVATCLVGNNIANYVTTFAVSWGVVLLMGQSSEASEVIATLLFAPVLFLSGEMVPKSLYYQVPYGRLRQNMGIFRWVYFAFLPVTYPLVWLTNALENWTGQSHQPVEFVLGRNRFVQLVSHGKQEGVLKDIQSRLANGILQLAPQLLRSSLIPSARVIGVTESMSCQEMLDVARSYGMPVVPVGTDEPNSWFGYVRVRELASGAAKPFIHPLPRLHADMSKLEALNILRSERAPFGVVEENKQHLGLIARQGLIEQLFRPKPVSPLSETGVA
ncbi:MAG: CNNM domain-containing protein [Planctomycetaceae bacterium]